MQIVYSLQKQAAKQLVGQSEILYDGRAAGNQWGDVKFKYLLLLLIFIGGDKFSLFKLHSLVPNGYDSFKEHILLRRPSFKNSTLIINNAFIAAINQFPFLATVSLI